MSGYFSCEKIKQQLSAFICRETNWYLARWIQVHLLGCSQCREEFRTLKQTWDKLDDWEISEPDESLPVKFHERLSEQFPQAFQETAPASAWPVGDWLVRLGYSTAILVICAATFLASQQTIPERIEHTVMAPTVDQLEFDRSATDEASSFRPQMERGDGRIRSVPAIAGMSSPRNGGYVGSLVSLSQPSAPVSSQPGYSDSQEVVINGRPVPDFAAYLMTRELQAH